MPIKSTKSPKLVLTRTELFRFFDERLKAVARIRISAPLAKPARVLRAEKICAEWCDHVERVSDQLRDRRMSKIREIQNELIRGNTDKALDLLTHLEAHDY